MENNSRKWPWIASAFAAVAFLSILVLTLVGDNQLALGGVTNYDTISASAFQVGPGCNDGFGTCTGTNLSLVKAGTCTLLANASVSATSTANFDCAFTGVQSGDIVQAHLRASTTLASQYVIRGVQASTTSGWITFSLLNLTGAAATPAATPGFGSSTEVYVFRTTN